MAATTPATAKIPESILIIGGGVFGLSTLHALLTNPDYNQTHITLLDAYIPPPSSSSPEPHLPTSSLDSSRIIRSDYPKAAYSALANRAQSQWRSGWPTTLSPSSTAGPKPYHESSLLLTATTATANCAGEAYVRGSFDNVAAAERAGGACKRSRFLEGRGKVAAELGTGGQAGDWGYVNPNSGWADAEEAMRGLRSVCWELSEARGRVDWVLGKGERLMFETEGCGRVLGVRLEGGREIRAEVTVLAAGAWSVGLLPRSLGPRIRAAGQVVTYVDLEGVEERKRLGGKPVTLDLSSGMFAIFPPGVEEKGYEGRADEQEERWHVKIARHGWGYAHKVMVEDTEPGGHGEREIFIPAPVFSPIPREGQDACREFLRQSVPELAGRPFANTRLCWYTDTGTGDFIIDWLPDYSRSLLVATGGSGHGFKFSPVFGELIVKKLQGRLGSESELDAELAKLWRWRTDAEVRDAWKEGEGDGSRGGPKGMIWKVKMEKKQSKL